MKKVKEDSKVSVHYTGRLKDGEIFDSSKGKEPLTFIMGEGQLISGFEKGVVGMELNETKTVNIPYAEAYGPVRDELIQEVDRSKLPPGLDPEVGQKLTSEGSDGSKRMVNVVATDDQSITIDANHALAGKDLIFDIEVVSIQ